MKPIIEYVITCNGEYHSTHETLRKARKVYRSLINIGEIEGNEGIIELLHKKTIMKTLNTHELNSDFMGIEDFAESSNM